MSPCLVRQQGLEPRTAGLEGRCSIQLSYWRIPPRVAPRLSWPTVTSSRRTRSGRLDSNQRPPAPKAGALPDCATPRKPPCVTRDSRCHKKRSPENQGRRYAQTRRYVEPESTVKRSRDQARPAPIRLEQATTIRKKARRSNASPGYHSTQRLMSESMTVFRCVVFRLSSLVFYSRLRTQDSRLLYFTSAILRNSFIWPGTLARRKYTPAERFAPSNVN